MSNLFTPKIYTPSGFVNENILDGKKALDVGCGQRKLLGAIGMDVVKNSKADVSHDFNKLPWPFQDNHFDVVLMNHSLEHVASVPSTLKEVHRISKPNARVIIQVPYFRSVDAFNDPTHTHFFAACSLDYFCENAKLSNYNYTPFHFKKLGFWYGWPHNSRNPFKQILKRFVHKHPNFYDQHLSVLLPVECLTWELEVTK
jgi:SAM-dependent methyltransferase